MRVIRMADVLGAAGDFGADGLSYDNWDSVPGEVIDAVINGDGIAAPEPDVMPAVAEEYRQQAAAISPSTYPPAFVRQPVRRGTSLLKR